MRQELTPHTSFKPVTLSALRAYAWLFDKSPKTVTMDQEVGALRFFGLAIGLEKSVGAPSFDFQQSRPVKFG
jgi:hypothetical protein